MQKIIRNWQKVIQAQRAARADLHLSSGTSERHPNVITTVDCVFARARSSFKRVKDAINISKRGVIAVLDGTALKASCCLYEMWATLHMRGLQYLKIASGNPVPAHDWDEAVLAVDLYACKATKQRDRGIILKEVSEKPGVEELNTVVKVRKGEDS
jgi:hypothetical protein